MPDVPLELRASLDTWVHHGSLADVERSKLERWITIDLGLVF
jgi:hypothetical protein